MKLIVNESTFLGVIRSVALAGIVASGGGCEGTLPDIDGADPVVAATWYDGIHFLPGSATRNGDIMDISYRGNEQDKWEQRIQNEILKPGARVPAVIYLHGSAGPTNAGGWAVDFAEYGYALFAPDSFERPGRENLANTGQQHWRMILRKQEMRYALAQLRSISWIDSDRLILAGFSEGAQAAANYSGGGFMAVMLFGTDCRFGGPNAPSGVAVLNVVGANDRFGYGGGCSFWRTVGGSKSVTISGLGHNVQGVPETKAAIAQLLIACCGYKPPDRTAGMGVEETSRELIGQAGDLATMEAQMRADDARSQGDDAGYKFWMKVREAAFKIVTQ
jgi:hypothetical protein